jgi:outer membrane protein assembly factor BamB
MRYLIPFFLVLTQIAYAAEVTSPRHRVIGIQRGTLASFDKNGKVEWTYDGIPDAHTIQELPNGNILTQNSWTNVIELNRSGNIVWSYDSATMNGNEGKEIEVHAALRLPNGWTMIAECGSGRIIEVDRKGRINHEIKLQLDKPNFHRDTRRVHKLENGNYLVAHEGDGKVREYTPTGKVIWTYELSMQGKASQNGHGPEAWGNKVNNAIRLRSGNTLIATGDQHSVIEVNPAGEIVWSILPGDLPDMVFAMTKQIEELPNGNFIIGNTYGTNAYP